MAVEFRATTAIIAVVCRLSTEVIITSVGLPLSFGSRDVNAIDNFNEPAAFGFESGDCIFDAKLETLAVFDYHNPGKTDWLGVAIALNEEEYFEYHVSCFYVGYPSYDDSRLRLV